MMCIYRHAKNQKRIPAALLAGVLCLLLTGCGQPAGAQLFAMDTVMDFTAYGRGADNAIQQCQTEILEMEKLLSRTRENSEISAINAAPGQPVEVARSVSELISAALGYSAATGGAFDITVAPVVSAWGFTSDTYQVPDPQTLAQLLAHVGSEQVRVTQNGETGTVTIGNQQAIDLGGIAKGYASDVVQGIFAVNGVEHASVSLGGNVCVRGGKPDGSPWRVGIRDPQDTEAYVGVLQMTDGFAVTSGGYQRYFEENGKIYHHIIDPATGYPAENGLLSVTVVAGGNSDSADGAAAAPGNGTLCDAFSTALFVMGEEKALDFWRTSGYSFNLVLVTEDGRVLVTPEIADQFTVNEESDYTYEVIR